MVPGWTVATLIDDLAGRGDAPALIAVTAEGRRGLSSRALAGDVRALAGGLIGLGIVPGEAVGLIAPNGMDWVVARLALGAAGAVAVALDDAASEEELGDFVRESGCRRWLSSPAHVATLRAIGPSFELIVLADAAPPGTRSWRALFFAAPSSLPALDPAAPAMLVYTSGTTGAAKSFLLTSANLAANLRPLVAANLVGRGDNVLLPLPLHHVYPLVVGLLTPLIAGAAVVFPASAGGPDIIAALRQGDVSAVVGVPRLYQAMISGLRSRLAGRPAPVCLVFDLLLALAIAARRRLHLDLGQVLFTAVRASIAPRLRLLVSGGARLNGEVLWPLVGLGFEVRSGYGLAETASIFTGNLPGAERLESEGRPFTGELRIAEPDHDGVGQIQLKGPSLFAGYRNNPAADAEAFTADGWFRTTDLGRRDADGFLYVAGRRSEVIVLGGGKKVDPEGLEKIYGADPAIREVAILERSGGLVALVVPETGAADLAATQIADRVRVALAGKASGLPSYQRVAGFALSRTPLPRTRLGKFQRFRLRALYEAARAGKPAASPQAPGPADRELLGHPVARELLTLLGKRHPDRPVSLDAHPLIDLGIDSLEWVSLSLAIKERLGIVLDETDLANAATVRDLVKSAVARSASTEATTAPEAERLARDWLAPLGPGPSMLGRVIFGLNWLVMRAFFRVRAEGLGHIPADGPWVLVANHGSDLDALLLAAAIGYRNLQRLYWSGDATRLFARPWLFPLIRAVRIFPVDDRAPSRALALAESVLRRGDRLAWFPEGWRSPDGTLQRFFPGIGELLHRMPVAIVPAYIAGSYEALPRHRRLPRPHRVTIHIGRPVPPAELGNAGARSPQEIADRLRQAVAELIAASGSVPPPTPLP
jgi:long-chain acyl-CoA synthetase